MNYIENLKDFQCVLTYYYKKSNSRFYRSENILNKLFFGFSTLYLTGLLFFYQLCTVDRHKCILNSLRHEKPLIKIRKFEWFLKRLHLPYRSVKANIASRDTDNISLLKRLSQEKICLIQYYA
jgi:hypothetical protein